MAKETPIFPRLIRHILLFLFVLSIPSLSWATACDPETQNCQCGADTTGDGYFDIMARCPDTPQGAFCELEALECFSLYVDPTCYDVQPGIPGMLNIETDLCEHLPDIECPDPYEYYDPLLKMCTKAVSCLETGIFDTTLDKCIIEPDAFCATGYNFSETAGSCIAPLECPQDGEYEELTGSNLYKNLQGLWKFEDDFSDSSGNGNHGTASDVAFTTGKFGQAASLTYNGYIELPNSSSLKISSPTPSTIAGWVRFSNFAWGWNPLLIVKDRYYGLWYYRPSTFLRTHYHNGSRYTYTDASISLTTNTWYHLAQVFDGSTLQIYLNGRLIHEGITNAGYSSRTEYSPVMGRGWSSTGGGKFYGLLDEVGIWDRALTPEEIRRLSEGKWIPTDTESRCAMFPDYSCPTGYEWVPETTYCKASLTCNIGTFYPDADTCLEDPEWRCPDNYSWDNILGVCISPEGDCPTDRYPGSMTKDEGGRLCYWDDPSLMSCDYGRWGDVYAALGYWHYETDASTPEQCTMDINCYPGKAEFVNGAWRCLTSVITSTKCPAGTADSGSDCISDPTCPSETVDGIEINYTFDAETGRCESAIDFPAPYCRADYMTVSGITASCPGGYVYNPLLEECLTDIQCPAGGALDLALTLNGKPACKKAPVPTCPDTGHSYDTNLKKCAVDSICPTNTTHTTLTQRQRDLFAPYTDFGGNLMADSGLACERERNADWSSRCSFGDGRKYLYDVDSRNCYTNHICPSDGSVIFTEETCVKEAVQTCPDAGYSAYDTTLNLCLAESTCQAEGIVDTERNKCKAAPAYRTNCPDGSTYSETSGYCEAYLGCPDGQVINEASDSTAAICTDDPVSEVCLSGMVFDAALGLCTAPLPCPEGTSYNASISKCTSGPIVPVTVASCSDGFLFDEAANLCTLDPTEGVFCFKSTFALCPSGIIDTDLDTCVNNPMASCPGDYVLEQIITQECAEGFVYDEELGKCTAPIPCPAGKQYETDETLGLCVASLMEVRQCYDDPICPNYATLFLSYSGKCSISLTTTCPPGFTYSSVTTKCEIEPACAEGTYNPDANACARDYTPSCPYSYSSVFDTTTETYTCRKYPPDCPTGSAYSDYHDKCVADGKCSDGSVVPDGSSCADIASCPITADYIMVGTRCEKSPPLCVGGAVYNFELNQCIRDRDAICPDGYATIDDGTDICHSYPLCGGEGSYDQMENICVANADSATHFCALNGQLYSDLALCTNECRQTDECSVGTLQFANSASVSGGQEGDYRIIPDKNFIRFDDPSGSTSSVMVSPCRISGDEINFPYNVNSVSLTFEAASPTTINISGYAYSGVSVITSFAGSWSVYGCAASGTMSLFGTADEPIGFNTSLNSVYPHGAYSSGGTTTEGEIVFTPTEACPIAPIPCVDGQCTLEVPCDTILDCPEGYFPSEDVTKCLGSPTCPGTGTFVEETDSCQDVPVFQCPSGFMETTIDGEQKCVDDAYCDRGGMLDLEKDMCRLCPTGLRYNATTGECDDLPECPRGTEFDFDIGKCLGPAECPDGLLVDDLCVADYVPTCPDGWTFDDTFEVCVQDALCPTGSVLNLLTDRCEIATACPEGFAPKFETGNCEIDPECSNGGTFDVDTLLCWKRATYSCSSSLIKIPSDPYVSDAACIYTDHEYSKPNYPDCPDNKTKDEVDPSYPDSYERNYGAYEYDTDTDRCESEVFISCPGEYPLREGDQCLRQKGACSYGTYDAATNKCRTPYRDEYSCPYWYWSGTEWNKSRSSWILNYTDLNCYSNFLGGQAGCPGNSYRKWAQMGGNNEFDSWGNRRNYWWCPNPAKTADTHASPDGNKTADTVLFGKPTRGGWENSICSYIEKGVTLEHGTTAGRTFTFSMWARKVGGNNSTLRVVISPGGQYWYSKDFTLGSDWKRVTFTKTIPNNITYGSVVIRLGGTNNAEFVFADAQLQEGTGTDVFDNYCVSNVPLICIEDPSTHSPIGTAGIVYTPDGEAKTRCISGGGDGLCPSSEGKPKEIKRGVNYKLAAWWKLDGDWKDYSGHLNHLSTASGAFDTGKYGQAGKNFGSDTVAQDSSTLDLNGNRFTFAAWINTTTRPYYQAILGKIGWWDSGWWSYNFHVTNSGGLHVNFVNTGHTSFPLTSDSAIGTGWHHVAATYNGSSLVLYIDGEIAGRRSASGNIRQNGHPVRIGAWWYRGTNYFQGLLDDVGIWSRSLSQPEIQKLMVHDWTAPGYCETETIYTCPAGTKGGWYQGSVEEGLQWLCSSPPVCPPGGGFDGEQDICIADATDPSCAIGYTLDTFFDPPMCIMPMNMVCEGGGVDRGRSEVGSPAYASASSTSGSYFPSNAFDGDPGTKWAGSPVSTLKYDLGSEKVIKAYQLYRDASNPANSPREWTFEGSTDGIEWIVLDRRLSESIVDATRSYFVENIGEYRHYRFNITGNNGGGNSSIGEVYLYSAYIDPLNLGDPFCSLAVDCPGIYSFSEVENFCEAPPYCHQSGIFSSENDLCIADPDYICAENYTYSDLTGLCEHDPVCPECPTCPGGVGEYSTEKNQCYMGDTECPHGRDFACHNVDGIYMCSPYECMDMGDAVTILQEADLTSYTDDGDIDEEGACSGMYLIFNGQASACRVSGIQTKWFNCCNASKDSGFFGLIKESCEEREYKTVIAREDKKCRYMGEYCKEEWDFIFGSICVQREKTYCCFDSLLARVVHEQGRPQLKTFNEDENWVNCLDEPGYEEKVACLVQYGDWGTTTDPNCTGFTPEEFQMIDFSKIDLREFSDEITDTAKDSMSDSAEKAVTDSMNEYFQDVLQ